MAVAILRNVHCIGDDHRTSLPHPPYRFQGEHPNTNEYGPVKQIRIIFRLCQYAQGTDPSNPVLTHEAYEYVFDAVPMFIALVLLNVVHPGRVLQGPESEFPRVSWAEKKRLKREKKQAKRERKEAKRVEKEMRKGGQSGWWWNRGRKRGSETFEILPVQEGVEGGV